MSTIDHTAELNALIEKIKALPNGVYCDAITAASSNDFAGLAYIANLAEGLPGHMGRSLGRTMDLADLLRGITPRLVHGRGR